MENEIRNAVKVFGCNGNISIKRNGFDTVSVMIEGEYFWLYDVCRHTFVD